MSEPCLEDRFLDLAELLEEALGLGLSQIDFLARFGVLSQFYLDERSCGRLLPRGSDSPGYVRARDHVRQTASFGFHASLFLQQLLDRLQESNIRVLTFKGAVLSQLQYGQLTRRPFGDIDLLVSPEDLPLVQLLFLEMGLKRGYPSGLSFAQDKALVRFGKAMNFSRPPHACFVDLHWRLFSHWLALEVPFEELWQRRQVVRLEGLGSWPTLGTEDQVLFLALHGAQDGWRYLKSLLDLACFMSRYQVDWELVCRLSGPRLALLRQGVSLPCSLLGVSCPREITPYFSDRRQAFNFLCEALAAKKSPHHRLLLPSLWTCSVPEALERSLGAFLNPAVDDICSVDLPVSLISAYVLVRCYRLLRKALHRKRILSYYPLPDHEKSI